MKKYVSRAGEKLEHALNEFHIYPSGWVCADFGSSTGGFVDCLLQHDAQKIYAVETGYGQLDWKLRKDKRVIVMERTNAMHVELPEKIDLITIDTGWTRQELIIPHAVTQLKQDGKIISLIKPHYEAQGRQLIKGRIQEKDLNIIIEDIKDLLGQIVLVKKIIQSPLVGKKGKNKEFFFWCEKKK